MVGRVGDEVGAVSSIDSRGVVGGQQIHRVPAFFDPGRVADRDLRECLPDGLAHLVGRVRPVRKRELAI
jgi:hypothetical protein